MAIGPLNFGGFSPVNTYGGVPDIMSMAAQAMGMGGAQDSLALSPFAMFALPPQEQQQVAELYKELWLLQQQMQQQLASGDYPGAQATQQRMQQLYSGLDNHLGRVTAPPPGVDMPGGPPETGGGPGANAVEVNPNHFHGGTPMGRQLASIAMHHATDGTGDGHHCYHNVKQDLARVGINVTGGSAYQAADQLANNPRVQEVRGLHPGDLHRLPPGAIVVWNRGNGHEYGHISVAMGDGREASDVMRNQVTHYGTSFRVFLPNDRGHAA
jgi:hypothetical protein